MIRLALPGSIALSFALGCGSEPAPGAVSPAMSARFEALDRELGASCAGSAGPTACAPASFCETASRWSMGCDAMKSSRRELGDHFLKQLEAGVTAAAYPLAYLEIETALPTLRSKLVASRDRSAFEGGDKGGDAQYPHQMALIVAIESLSKTKAGDYVHLRIEERERLEREGELDDDNAKAARWLLFKLTGKKIGPKTSAE